MSVAIEGPDHAIAGEDTCFRARSSGEAESVRWTWGDGEESEGAQACHAWPLVGARVLGVEVRARGMRADAARSIAVVLRPADVPPTWSSTIVASAERVVAVRPDHDAIAVIAAQPFALEREIPVCDRPRTVALSDEVIAVACQGDAVALIDARTLEVTRTVAFSAGSEPYGVLADPRGGAFAIALRRGVIATIDTNGALLDEVDVGPEPRGLAMNAEGTLLATRWRSTNEGASIYTIDARDPRALSALGTTALPPDRGLNSDTDNDGVLSFLNMIVPSPDGTRAVIPALKSNVVTGMFVSGEPLTPTTTARGVIGEVTFGDPSSAAVESYRQSFDDLDFAAAAVFSPLGDRLYLAFLGAQVVTAVDAYDFYGAGSISSVGEAPQGLAISPDGRTLYVDAYLSRSVRAYDVTDLSRDPPLLGEVIAAEEPFLPDVLLGARVFHRSRDPRMSRTSYLSCASCHLDGEGDALVWDFTQRGEGLRNTIELRGRAGRAPLHWTANFDEVQDFEHDVRAGQGGAGFLTDEVFAAHAVLGEPKAGLSPELDALAAFVESLTSYGLSPRRDDPARTNGESIFVSNDCASCHSGIDFTDSAFSGVDPILHDVGTLGAGSGQRLGMPLTGLDTPTLRGLWRTAPYLHDGSAPTLLDVLERHGSVPFADRGDLAAFLAALDDGT